jgi:arginine deiminase
MISGKNRGIVHSGLFFRNLLVLLAVMACYTPVRIFAASPELPRQCQATVSSTMLQQSDSFTIGSGAEWLQAKTVVVHTPGDEVFFGLTHPAAALFERPFSLDGARREHQDFICLMAKNNVQVLRLTDILLAGTVDAAGAPLPGAALDQLRRLALESLRYQAKSLPRKLAVSQTGYKQDVLSKLHPMELIQIILLQPTITLQSTKGHNTGFTASYGADPVMNLYFMRDQVITTAKGLVIGHFNAPQRELETRIVRFAYKKLGITPVYEVAGTARLEGGDFIPAGGTALIGQGLRTNAEAIRQLLQARVFGTPRVAVIKDSWKNQDQMHLDTYFNIIDQNLAVIVEERIDQRDAEGKIIKAADPAKRSIVDLYELKDDQYRKIAGNIPFQKFLEEDLGMKLIPVSNADQLKYGINFLATRGRNILAIDGVSSAYKQRLANEGVDATWMDFSNLTGGYGAAHCTTQVIRRE